MKLQKIPLSEQLEHADIATQANSLYKKYAGQRFMGVRPDSHKEEMFKETSIRLDEDDHPVPVSNFLNAQCTYNPSPYLISHQLNNLRLLRNNYWHSASNIQGRPRYWFLQPVGALIRVWLDRLLPSHQVRLVCIVIIQEKWLRIRDPIWLWELKRLHLSRHCAGWRYQD